jgi:stage II sporulation SpoE-like protein
MNAGPQPHPRKAVLLLGIVAGLAVFAAGVALAMAFLPEWREAGPAADKALFRERYRELTARAGLTLEPGEPRSYLTTIGRQCYQAVRLGGKRSSFWRPSSQSGVFVEVVHEVRGPAGWPDGKAAIDFSPDGQPLRIWWWNHRFNPFKLGDPEAILRFADRLTALLLRPGERPGSRRIDYFANMPRLIVPIEGPIEGGRAPEHLLITSSQLNALAWRQAGKVTDAVAGEFDAEWDKVFASFLGGILVFSLLAGLFVVLAFKSRLSIVNGALLALVALATLNPDPALVTFGSVFWSVGAALLLAAWIFLLWSCAESLLRSTGPKFTTSLDALRAGRLGPRGGRALLLGLGFGSALGGLRLALMASVQALPGLQPLGASLDLPLFSALGSPVENGIATAAGVALALAAAFRLLPLRWAPLAAAVAAGVMFLPLAISPLPARLTAGVLSAALLVYVARRHGLTALLAAAVVADLLPAAAYSAQRLDWMPGAFAATALPPVAFALLGWLGLSRSASAEVEQLSPPAFVRRLEEERRLKNEMDLLARMQRGLLPRTLPRMEGYEMAAHSVIATEAGGDLYDLLRDDEGQVWLAAGDVAGHGYSCAVAQAMTKAALASLIGRGRTPAEVLRRMDRVLRAAGAKRNFTTLALLRLRLETGEATLSNAGHPYPLLAAGGEVEELELSGLPLGQGPARQYTERTFHLPPGAALVFCSDGLFEAADGDGSEYGSERARTLLRVVRERSADKILEALLADWRHHLRATQPLDDTTVVVLKRVREDGGR